MGLFLHRKISSLRFTIILSIFKLFYNPLLRRNQPFCTLFLQRLCHDVIVRANRVRPCNNADLFAARFV
jgi:hypothetical protein